MVSEDGDTPAANTGEAKGSATPSTGDNATTGKNEEQIAADILAADDNVLYNQAMAAKKEMVKFCSESEDEKTTPEYERTLVESMAQAVELGGNNMDDLGVGIGLLFFILQRWIIGCGLWAMSPEAGFPALPIQAHKSG